MAPALLHTQLPSTVAATAALVDSHQPAAHGSVVAAVSGLVVVPTAAIVNPTGTLVPGGQHVAPDAVGSSRGCGRGAWQGASRGRGRSACSGRGRGRGRGATSANDISEME